jgi:hypothetical protein
MAKVGAKMSILDLLAGDTVEASYMHEKYEANGPVQVPLI